MKQLLTQKELAYRWGVCRRTVQREVRRFELVPADFIGQQPLFARAAVERLERLRRLLRSGNGAA